MERPKHPEDLKGKEGSTSGPVIRSTKGNWTPEEDEALRKAVERFKGKNWKKIAECLKDRTDIQCLHRWQKVLNPDVKKGPWSEEEDKKLKALVQQHGQQWSKIAKDLPGRIGKQCRERWQNHLDPGINKNAWTEEEELTLIREHQIHGNKWAELVKFLPGRSANSIKNHWNCSVSVKKKLDSYDASSPSDQCQSLPLTALENESIAASSSRMHISGDEGNSRPEVDAEESELQGVSNDAKQDFDLDLLTPKMDDTGKNQALQSLVRLGDQPSSLNLDTDPETETDEEWRSFLRNDDDDGITEQQELSYIPKESVKLVPPNSLSSPSRANKISFPTEDKPAEKDKRALSYEPSRSPSTVDPSFDNKDDHVPSNINFWSDPYITNVLENEEGRSFYGNDDDDDGITEQQELSFIRKESLKRMPPNSLSSPRANKSFFPIEDKPAEKDPQGFADADSPFYTYDLRPSKNVSLGDDSLAYLFAPSNPLLSSNINSDSSPDVTRGWQVEVNVEVNRPTSFVEGSLAEKKEDSFPINTESSSSLSPASITSSSRIDVEVSGKNVNSEPNPVKKCMHCEATETLQWRPGPMGPKTLCNACGVRYKSGRLY